MIFRLPYWSRYIACAVVLIASTASGQSVDERFAKANKAYQDKDYASAISQYSELRDRYQVNDAALHFNLGNSYYQLQRYGRAVHAYKRALNASPDEASEASIRNNLTMTMDALVEQHRKDVSKSVTVLDETHGIWFSLAHFMSSNVLAWGFLITWSGFFLICILRRLEVFMNRPGLRALLLICGPLAIVFGGLLIGQLATEDSVIRGVVVERSARMREGRTADATLTDVPEGLEVRVVVDSDPQETQIQLSNGKRGWISSDAVDRI